ncbi:hypothetical protein [Actinokineospora inagensis]|uniref:hypothetical protein n=1 Tax=Actinokineospora inagensis TaxID=103730 RepID=UPI0003FCD8ED|nr:hypothetical protein [Actinokineospora inagensis]
MVRTPAALRRLLDVVPALLGDSRVEVRFTVDGGSVFAAGLPDKLTAVGALWQPWENACQERFDLALAASDKSDLHLLDAPVVLMPHGAGYHRQSAGGVVSGLNRSALVVDGRVLPHTVVVAHGNQVAALRSVDARLAEHALVARDPCLDRITASEGQRHRHRTSFDADGRRMVLLCSTWGTHSLFGTTPDLAEHLVTALPADHYRVAMTLHPNVWQRHGSLQVRAWLRRAVRAGLVLIRPDEDWRPALLATDVVVSDHGSLTCYAAAARRPVLLAADGGPEVVPGSPLARLLTTLPRLNGLPGDVPVPPEDAVNAIFDHREPAAMDDLFYRILDLPPPECMAPEPIPLSSPEFTEPTHYRTTTHAEVTDDTACLTLTRTTARQADGSLAADEMSPEIGLIDSASAIWSSSPFPDRTSATTHAHALLDRYPGARLAVTAVDSHAPRLTKMTTVVAFRDGQVRVVDSTVSTSVAAAALHWWSLLPAPRPSRITISAGAASGELVVH